MKKLLSLLPALLLGGFVLFAQDRVVTGKVTDESTGSPIGGVSVLVKGMQGGTSTKEDGTFQLTVSAKAKTLVFSSVNYGSKEVSIDNRSEISVKMLSEERSVDAM
jgi:hypothetical protein